MLQYDDTFNAAYTVLGLEGIGSDIHSEYEGKIYCYNDIVTTS